MELLTLQAIWAVLAIVLIDIVLAGDNALVIGMAANKLPEAQRKRVILWGTIGAVAIRFVSVAILTSLLLIPGLRLIGGLALIYIGWKLAFQDKDHTIGAKDTFWSAVGTIVVADAVMGIDNALGIAAAANGDFGLVIFGLLVSVPIILFGSTVIARILARWPNLIFLGSFVLFLVAMQMILKEPFIDTYVDPLHDWIEFKLPWLVAIILTAKQYYRSQIKKSL
jgi:YjbE family integral membrane protein